MSIVKHYELELEKLNFFQKRNFFIDNYPNTVNLYLLGEWFRAFNTDAKIINKIMRYKLFKDKYGNICCGFPECNLGKVEKYLNNYKINYNIINDDKYDLYDYGNDNSYLEYINSEKSNSIVETKKKKPKSNCVEIGDTVTIKNLKDNSIETYTIKQVYYESTHYDDYGLIDHSDIGKGEILSDAPFAKILLGLTKDEIFITKDEDAKTSDYQVINIKKGE